MSPPSLFVTLSPRESHPLLETLQGNASPVAAKSLRWNPVEYRPAAYRSHDPGSKQKGVETKDYPALNVLAFFGLTFYPTVPTRSGGRTAGLHRQVRETFFVWPIWSTPLGADDLLPIKPMNSTASIRLPRNRRISAAIPAGSIRLATAPRRFTSRSTGREMGRPASA